MTLCVELENHELANQLRTARNTPMRTASEVLTVARLPIQAAGGGSNPTPTLHFERGSIYEANMLLATSHYLGPAHAARLVFLGWCSDELVCCQVWRWPSARMLPSDGSWLELSRWCMTPGAGENGGSRMMGWARRQLRNGRPLTLVSYSDPVHGHDGALYKASGWTEAPTHHTDRLRANGVGYPSGHGSWDGMTRQNPKVRWIMELVS